MAAPFELLSLLRKETFKQWKNISKINVIYDTYAKSYCLEFTKGNKIETIGNHSCNIVDSHLIVQMYVESMNNFSIELGIFDSSQTKKRIIFSSSCKELTLNQMHVRVPFCTLPLNKWINVEFDLESICGYFSGKNCFRSLDSLSIQFEGRLKKICTIRTSLKEIILHTNSLHKTLQMPSGVEIENVVVKLADNKINHQNNMHNDHEDQLVSKLKGNVKSFPLLRINNNKLRSGANSPIKNNIYGNINKEILETPELNIETESKEENRPLKPKDIYLNNLEKQSKIGKILMNNIKKPNQIMIDIAKKGKIRLLPIIRNTTQPKVKFNNKDPNDQYNYNSKLKNKFDQKRVNLISNGKQNSEGNLTNPKFLNTLDYKKLAEQEKSNNYGSSLIIEDIHEIHDTTKIARNNLSTIEQIKTPHKEKNTLENKYGYKHELTNKILKESLDGKIDITQNRQLNVPFDFSLINYKQNNSISRVNLNLSVNKEEFNQTKPSLINIEDSFTPPLQD